LVLAADGQRGTVGLIDTSAVSIESKGPKLEGALHLPEQTPAPGIVVCHPHPLYGGDMRNNVVDAICDMAVAEGVAALRFNFRGLGSKAELKLLPGLGHFWFGVERDLQAIISPFLRAHLLGVAST